MDEQIRKGLQEHPELVSTLAQLIEAGRFRSFDEAPDDPLSIVVCGGDPAGINGAKQERCKCGAIIWVSPATQTVLAKRTSPAELSCIACFQKAAELMQA